MDKITIRSDGSRSVSVVFDEKDELARSRTKQSFTKECDINNIMARYRKTGLMPQMPGRPLYGDFSGAVDFEATVQRIQVAQEAFDRLPVDVRKRFNNDVAQCLEWVANEANYEEAISLKLRPKDEVKEAAKKAAADAKLAAEKAAREAAA